MLFTIWGEAPDGGAGMSLALVGDVNGDGLSDIMVADAGRGDDGGSIHKRGRTWLVWGKGDSADVYLEEVAAGVGGFMVDGNPDWEQFGAEVARAGDVNGDGLADMVVGHPSADVNGDQSGQAYLVYGKVGGEPVMAADLEDGVGGFVMRGIDSLDVTGRAVAGGVDLDGDGLSEIVVGAPSAQVDEVRVGRVFVVWGHAAETGDVHVPVELADLEPLGRGISIGGEREFSGAGTTVAFPGDINGDGRPDLAISAPELSVGSSGSGRVYFIFGRATRAEWEDVDLASIANNVGGFVVDGVGFQAFANGGFAAGDFNGDGVDDALVTSADYGPDETPYEGRLHVVLGRSAPSNVRLEGTGEWGWSIDGWPDSGFGASARLGDVTGDARSEVVLVSPRGLSLIVGFGAPPEIRLSFEGLTEVPLGVQYPSPARWFGWDMDAGFDVSGDGRPDVIVADVGDPAQGRSNRIHVFGFPAPAPW